MILQDDVIEICCAYFHLAYIFFDWFYTFFKFVNLVAEPCFSLIKVKLGSHFTFYIIESIVDFLEPFVNTGKTLTNNYGEFLEALVECLIQMLFKEGNWNIRIRR